MSSGNVVVVVVGVVGATVVGATIVGADKKLVVEFVGATV